MSRDDTKIASIDQLRGAAALAVVICHIAGHFYGLDRFSPGAGKLFGWLGQWGVALFFVISGFCIRLPLARARVADPAARLDVTDYLAHRFIRIAPPYWIAVAICIGAGMLATTAQIDGSHSLFDVVMHALALHTLWPSTFLSINGVFWTIGIEAHFYLAYLLLAGRPIRTETVAGLLVLALVAYWAASKLLPAGDPWRMVGQQLFITSFWQWCLGAWLADRFARGRWTVPAWPLWAARFVLLAASLTMGLVDPTLLGLHLTYWLLPVAAWGVVATFVIRPRDAQTPSNPLSRGFSFLGRISYSLYLLHPAVMSLIVWASRGMALPAWAGSTAELVMSVLAAGILYRLIERPLLRWRRRRLGSTVDSTALAAA